MLQPRRVKYRKQQRGRMKGAASSNNEVILGEYGIKALQPAWITTRQIESARVTIARRLKRGGKVWVRLFPAKSVSKKAAETRQGGGKAAVEFWAAIVKPGQVMFEIGGVPEEDAVQALKLASYKLPIATRTVSRDRFKTLEGT